MRILFWVILGLTGVLLVRNAHYAFRTYFANRQRMIFTVYFGLLVALGSLVMHVTAKTMDIVQDVKDMDALEP